MTRVKLRVSQIILLNNCCTREKFTFHTLNLLKKYSQKRLPWEPPRQKSPVEATFAICHNQPQLYFRLPKWVHLLLLMTLSISTSNLETTSMVVVGKIFFEERFSLFIRKLVRIISLLHKEKKKKLRNTFLQFRLEWKRLNVLAGWLLNLWFASKQSIICRNSLRKSFLFYCCGALVGTFLGNFN